MGLKYNPFTGNLDISSAGGSGGSTPTFKTMQTPAGTSPVAVTSTDTLTLSSSDSSISITGNSSTDTINFQISRPTPASAKTANFTIGNTDTLVKVDNTAGAFTATMPSPSANVGRPITILNVGSGTNLITVSPSGSETFGQPAYTALHLSTPGESWTLMSDGTNWMVMSHYCCTTEQTFPMVVTGSAANPTLASGAAANQAYWSRIGNKMRIVFSYDSTGGSGQATGSGDYIFNLPSGYQIDGTKITVNTNYSEGIVGTGLYYQANNTSGIANAKAYSSAGIALSYGGALFGSGSVPLGSGSVTRVSFEAVIPITYWEA